MGTGIRITVSFYVRVIKWARNSGTQEKKRERIGPEKTGIKGSEENTDDYLDGIHGRIFGLSTRDTKIHQFVLNTLKRGKVSNLTSL